MIPSLRKVFVPSHPDLQLQEMSAGVFTRFRRNLAECSEKYGNRNITWYDWKVFICLLSLVKDGRPLLQELVESTPPQSTPPDLSSFPSTPDNSPPGQDFPLPAKKIGEVLNNLTPDQFMEILYDWIDEVPKDWIDEVYAIYEKNFDSVSEEATATLKND
jgi:hypothetical protein